MKNVIRVSGLIEFDNEVSQADYNKLVDAIVKVVEDSGGGLFGNFKLISEDEVNEDEKSVTYPPRR